jgi:membrane fusion protein (multidrug efflux system)
MPKTSFLLFSLATVITAQTPTRTQFATVVSHPAQQTVDLPAEIAPYLTTTVEARVAGYVERVLVDRGSIVSQGQLLVELSAPEMSAQIAAARSNVSLAKAEESQAEAQFAAAQSTYERMKKAAETPGAISGNELIQMEKQKDAAQSLVHSRQGAVQASRQSLRALEDMQSYLRVTAPFDGVITERLVHPGALVQAGNQTPLLKLQQILRLRITVPVPEQYVGEIVRGAAVPFRVPAFPDRTFRGKIARVAHSLDEKTRTMNVELDFLNQNRTLAPGMYPTVNWPVRSRHNALFVPAASVVTTTARVFVIKDEDGKARWIDVRKEQATGDQVQVSGAIHAGDRIVLRATDEIREGAPLENAH